MEPRTKLLVAAIVGLLVIALLLSMQLQQPAAATTKSASSSSSSSSSSSASLAIGEAGKSTTSSTHRKKQPSSLIRSQQKTSSGSSAMNKKQKQRHGVAGATAASSEVTAPFLFVFNSDHSDYSGNNLYHPSCHLSQAEESDGGCKISPWYRAPSASSSSNKNRKGNHLPASVLDQQDDDDSTTDKTSQKTQQQQQQQHRAVSAVVAQNEFQCKNRPSERDRLRLSELVSKQQQETQRDDAPSPEELLLNFKRFTSWMFDKWYDWGVSTPTTTATTTSTTGSNAVAVQCSADKENDGVIRGGHEEETTVYKLENFCLKPMGQISGFGAHHSPLSEYRGTHESFKVNGQNGRRAYTRAEPGMQGFLGRVENLERKPSCFIDNISLILIAVTDHFDNVGHIFHRNGGLLRVIETVFPNRTKKNTTMRTTTTTTTNLRDGMKNADNDLVIGYIVTKGHGMRFVSSPEVNRRQNIQRLYYDAIDEGAKWFSTFEGGGGAEEKEKLPPGWEKRPEMFFRSDPGNDDFKFRLSDDFLTQRFAEQVLSTPVCFRRAYVYQDADERLAASPDFQSDARVVGRKTSFQLFGPRSSRDLETIDLLNERLRSCAFSSSSSSSSSCDHHERTSQDHRQDKKCKESQQRHHDYRHHRRVRANTTHPHVILLVRSVTRRFTLQPYLINIIANFVTNELRGGTFEVLEHNRLDMEQIIERFSKADVLIGMLGAGLIWSQLMPKFGGIMLEFNVPHYRCSTNSGINKNLQCDFGRIGAGGRGGGGGGSGAVSSSPDERQYHIAIHLDMTYPGLLRRPVDESQSGQYRKVVRKGAAVHDIAIGKATMTFALEKVKCLLRAQDEFPALLAQGGNRVDSVLFKKERGQLFFDHHGSPKMCQFSHSQLLPVFRKDLHDEDGDSLAAFVQMHLPPLLSLENKRKRGHNNNKKKMASPPEQNEANREEEKRSSSSAESESVQRMTMMMKHRRHVASALSRFQDRSEDRGLNIQLIFRCSILVRTNTAGRTATTATTASTKSSFDLSPAVLSEIALWRQLLSEAYKITIADFADGAENCPSSSSSSSPTSTSSTANDGSGGVGDVAAADALIANITRISVQERLHGVSYCRYPCPPSFKTDFHIVVRSASPVGGVEEEAKQRDQILDTYVTATPGMMMTFVSSASSYSSATATATPAPNKKESGGGEDVKTSSSTKDGGTSKVFAGGEIRVDLHTCIENEGRRTCHKYLLESTEEKVRDAKDILLDSLKV